jgi:hypothetical protein
MRKEKTIQLKDRERELVFKIREMPATKLESWILRALMLLAPALGKAGGESVTLTEAGRALQAEGLGLLSHVSFDRVKPLLDELLACCVRIDAGVEQVCAPETVDGFIEDVGTLFALRKEALALNLAFFGQGSGGPLSFLGKSSSGERAQVVVSRT